MDSGFFYPVILPSLICGLQGHCTNVHEPAEEKKAWNIMNESCFYYFFI